ncbi:MAG: hypothetical protein LRZ84_27320 [Desertifilum sp.]|nr:hypothetical protein [Desertifilum sp.]
MSDNPFRRAIASRKETEPEIQPPTPPESASTSPPPTDRKKRGRPATGKRSDEAWIGRTYYVKRETDLDVEELLLKLRRQGVEVDKSELVDLLLSAWVKWQQGENIENYISEITPRRK